MVTSSMDYPRPPTTPPSTLDGGRGPLGLQASKGKTSIAANNIPAPLPRCVTFHTCAGAKKPSSTQRESTAISAALQNLNRYTAESMSPQRRHRTGTRRALPPILNLMRAKGKPQNLWRVPDRLFFSFPTQIPTKQLSTGNKSTNAATLLTLVL